MIEQAFIIAMIVYAIWYSFQEEEIFGFVHNWTIGGKYLTSHPIADAIFNCPVCMVPWHGTYLYWIIYGWWLHTATWQGWLVVIFTAMGINAVLNKIIEK